MHLQHNDTTDHYKALRALRLFTLQALFWVFYVETLSGSFQTDESKLLMWYFFLPSYSMCFMHLIDEVGFEV